MSSCKSCMYKSEANNGLSENLEVSHLWFANEEWNQPAVAKKVSPQWKNACSNYEEKECQRHQVVCKRCGRKIKLRYESVKRVVVKEKPVYCYEKIIYDHSVIHVVPVFVKKVEKHIYRHEYRIEKQVIQEKHRFDETKAH